ncbi:hypothetical protein V8F20_012056 [Naviculisporaceae sp. PSN 640]
MTEDYGALARDGDESKNPRLTATSSPIEQYHPIPVINISERTSTIFPEDASNWGVHTYLMIHWYRNEEDTDHVLEFDPARGKFLPQSILRTRQEQEGEEKLNSDRAKEVSRKRKRRSVENEQEEWEEQQPQKRHEAKEEAAKGVREEVKVVEETAKLAEERIVKGKSDMDEGYDEAESLKSEEKEPPRETTAGKTSGVEEVILGNHNAAPKAAAVQDRPPTTSFVKALDMGMSSLIDTPALSSSISVPQASHKIETGCPWAGETRPNIIRLYPPPQWNDPYADDLKVDAMLFAEDLQHAPDIVKDYNNSEEDVLQLTFYCDGSSDLLKRRHQKTAGR